MECVPLVQHDLGLRADVQSQPYDLFCVPQPALPQQEIIIKHMFGIPVDIQVAPEVVQIGVGPLYLDIGPHLVILLRVGLDKLWGRLFDFEVGLAI